MIANFGLVDELAMSSKKELLSWINQFSQQQVHKIEDLGSGVVYCQLFSKLLPNHVNCSKIKHKAKHEWEYINNFKLLQQLFAKLGIDKTIEVNKIVKSKYSDNLEFAQWMKRFYHLNFEGQLEKLTRQYNNKNELKKYKQFEKFNQKIQTLVEEPLEIKEPFDQQVQPESTVTVKKSKKEIQGTLEVEVVQPIEQYEIPLNYDTVLNEVITHAKSMRDVQVNQRDGVIKLMELSKLLLEQVKVE